MLKNYIIAVLIFSCQFCTVVTAQSADKQSLSALETPHYKILHDTTGAEAKEIATILEFAYERFNYLFTANGFTLLTPLEKLTWYCFTDADGFTNHARTADNMNLYWLNSYYSAKTNAVSIVKPYNLPNLNTNQDSAESAVAGVYIMPSVDTSGSEITRILHEAAHQLAFNTGMQKQKVMYPVWLSEGLAANFENCIPTSAGNLRQRRLCEMYSGRDRLIPLNEFILITRMPESSDLRKDIYAQSCVFFKFLSEHHSESLRKYMSALCGLRTGWRSRAALHTEFIAAFGPVREMEDSWLNYLKDISAEQ